MNCDIPCSHLEDSDIADDVRCARKIHSIHSRLNGDGFTAWAAYEPYCKGQTQFTTDCFPNDQINQTIPSMNRNSLSNAVTKKPSPTSKKGKIFNRCELATELLVKYKIPKKQIHTWTCIAKYESNFDTGAVGRLNADGSGDHGLFQVRIVIISAIFEQPFELYSINFRSRTSIGAPLMGPKERVAMLNAQILKILIFRTMLPV